MSSQSATAAPLLLSYLQHLSQVRCYLPLVLGAFVTPLIFSPAFYEPYLTPKWLSIYGCTLLSSLILKREVLYPSLGKNSLLLFALFLYELIYFIFYHEAYATKYIVDRIAAVVLILYSFNVFFNNKNALYFLTYACIGSAFLISVSSLNPFGNTNMHAEFLGIAVIFLIAHLKHSNQNQRLIPIIFLFVIVLNLVMQHCRSVILALLLCTAYIFVKDALLSQKSIQKSEGIFALFLICLCVGLTFHSLPSYFSTPKLASIGERWEIWKGTLLLIKENIFGVGPGMFEYAFLPYKGKTNFPPSEFLIERSPHNEFLRYLSEDGIFFTLGLWLFFVVQFKRRLTKNFFISPAGDLMIPYFIYIFIQSLCQFPLANPVPFFVTSCMFGFFLAVSEPQGIKAKQKSVLLLPQIKYIFFAGFGILVTLQGYASYLIVNYPYDYEKSRLAYHLDPTNTSYPFYAIRSALTVGLYKEAETIALKELRIRPNHFPILFMLGYTYLLQGQKELGCRALERYNRLFPSPHSKERFIKENCQTLNSVNTWPLQRQRCVVGVSQNKQYKGLPE